jgi:hypothetical protein
VEEEERNRKVKSNKNQDNRLLSPASCVVKISLWLNFNHFLTGSVALFYKIIKGQADFERARFFEFLFWKRFRSRHSDEEENCHFLNGCPFSRVDNIFFSARRSTRRFPRGTPPPFFLFFVKTKHANWKCFKIKNKKKNSRQTYTHVELMTSDVLFGIGENRRKEIFRAQSRAAGCPSAQHGKLLRLPVFPPPLSLSLSLSLCKSYYIHKS